MDRKCGLPMNSGLSFFTARKFHLGCFYCVESCGGVLDLFESQLCGGNSSKWNADCHLSCARNACCDKLLAQLADFQ